MKNSSEPKEILIIKNITREGPGILGDILREHGIKNKVIDLSRGEKIHPLEKYGAVVVLGGPDSANDETLKMKGELAFIKKVLDAGIPYLGICLGLQTLVRAAGGEVVKSPVSEIGFRDQEGLFNSVRLTEYGRQDPLFKGIDDIFNVFHLHGETVVPAAGMLLLGEGRLCRNQILKAGSNAYGIQCHFELTPGMFKSWINEDPDLQKLDNEQLSADYNALVGKYSERGRRIFQNFVSIAGFR